MTGAIRKRLVEQRSESPIKQMAEPNTREKPSIRTQSTSPVRKAYFSTEFWNSSATKSLIFISLLAFVIRFALINEPAEVVFDEVHFGGFASNYLRREYFFDVHPPLGKLLIAGVGWLFGYDGGFTFANIGQSYTNTSAPYVALRMFMVLLGVASVALSYATMIEMGFSVLASTLAGGLLAFDNALVVQSRFILLDSILMFFISFAVYSWVKFRQQRVKAFQTQWWGWLLATGMAIGGATSVKMVGLFTVALIGVATIVDLWELADWRRHHSDRLMTKHFISRAGGLIALPIILYLASYYVHFAVLNRTGPGDAFMSAEFQTTLQGNQMHAKSRQVYYGHTIRLKSRLEDVYLHSHRHNYPRVHDDGKVSSEGQQVTGYPAKDRNNFWMILPAENVTLSHKSQVPIKNGDNIRLLHVGTGKVLYTHDVASPLTRTNMEVTVIDPNDVEKYDSTLWTLDLKTGSTTTLRALSCQFRLVNKVHQVALTNLQQPLPKWGFSQREINGDKRGSDETSKWIVWDVDEPMEEAESVALALKPKPRLSFFQKFLELQYAQVKHNAALVDNHPFKSDPISWPFVLRGVSYWDRNKMARIYLLGNPVAWYICIGGLVAFLTVAVRELIKERRGKKMVEEDNHFEKRFLYRGGYLLLSWALHYIPFFTMARTLYLHHYLPAYVMSAMVTGAITDYAVRRVKRPAIAHGIIAMLSIMAVATFFYFSPITYGTQVPSATMDAKKWLASWDWP